MIIVSFVPFYDVLLDVFHRVQRIMTSTPLSVQAVSALTTPFASHTPTPRSEPISANHFLPVSDVAIIFIDSLIQDFLGKKIRSKIRSPTVYVQLSKKEKGATNVCIHFLIM